jgi:hypothetical protein
VAEPIRHWLILASAIDAAQVLSGVRGAHEDVPPAGTQLHQAHAGSVASIMPPLSGTRLPFYVTGVSDYPDPSDWSHTTLGAFIADVGLDHAAWLARLAGLFDATVGRVVSAFDQWPVIVKGTGEGNEMRWIKSMVKGTLGVVEDFQFGLNWGKPGDDPNPSESELADIGADIATQFALAVQATDASMGGSELTDLWADDVKFTELGVVLQTQTDATSADGSGGNLSQAFETHWETLNGTPGLPGTGSTKSLPYEVAMAVSFGTEHRGPSGRGRAYLPPPKVEAIGVGGVFLTNPVTGGGTIFKKWFDNVKASQDLVPVIVSRRRIILNEITSISVGIVPDSQRRRRWHQLEAPVVVWDGS